MLPRALLRLATHWLVIIAMIATTTMVPAQAASEALQIAAAARMAATMADMPCGDDMNASAAKHERPCDCCTVVSCDLSACLGTACLPTLPRLAAAIPLDVVHAQWNAPAPPSRVLDTPLRPPIA
ncbi:hypothetical protein [Lysobacter tyrosinilyticus]